jgi:DNA-binding NarL/FixJ family response regulator
MKVLIADNDKEYRTFMGRILKMNAGLRVVAEAGDGEEAVRLSRQFKPDLVLMDIDMPGLDGLQATRRLKAELPQTRVIILSGATGRAYSEAAARHGAEAFLPKNAPISEILSAIHGPARGKNPCPPKGPLTILVADDHQIVREGLRMILEREGHKVVGEAADGQEAVRRALELEPDVALLDLSMPFKGGIEAVKEILRSVPRTRTILLTVHTEEHYVREALRAGAQGYVLKRGSATDLVQAIDEVLEGKTYLSPGISSEVIGDVS